MTNQETRVSIDTPAVAADVPTTPTSSKPIAFGSRHDEFINERLSKSKFLLFVFYRGKWCPFCHKYLREWSKLFKVVKMAGGDVVGVCAEDAETVEGTAAAWSIAFPMLSDGEASLAKFFNVAISAPNKRYRFGMSHAAVTAVARDGTTLFRWTSFPDPSNYMGGSKRPHPRDVLDIVCDELDACEAAREAAAAAAARRAAKRVPREYSKLTAGDRLQLVFGCFNFDDAPKFDDPADWVATNNPAHPTPAA